MTKKKRKDGDKQDRRSRLKWFLIILVTLSIVGIVDGIGSSSTYSNIDGSEYEARGCSERVIKNVLKAPSTAKFSEWSVEKGGYADYRVHVNVDAQNSFGVPLRSRWLCSVTFTADRCDTRCNRQ